MNHSRLIYGVFMLLLAIDHSTQQPTNGVSTSSLNYGNNDGLIGTLRNRTSSLTTDIMQRLEGPRDRVFNLIKPVVKSEFSRNVTNALNSIWNRVQATNISLIQHPLVKTNIVAPINSTFKILKQITAKEDDLSDSNIEVVDLDNPENARLFSEDNMPSNLENSRTYTMNAESSNMNEISVRTPVDTSANKKRRARFMDSYTYVSPDNGHKLLNNVRRNGMRQCLALALCESNCRPQLYSSSAYGRFRNLINRVESFDSNHEDYSYYLDARRNGNSYSNECSWCHQRYSCPHSRDYLVNQFSRQENFY